MNNHQQPNNTGQKMKLPNDFTFLSDPPRPYQLKSFLYGREKEHLGLFLDMGLGKTRVACDIGKYRIEKGEIKKILVVAPTTILYKWQKEIIRWTGQNSLVCHSNLRDKRAEFLTTEGYNWYIINYEALFKFLGLIDKLNPDMVIYDEINKYMKNFKSQRAKAAIYISDKAKYRMGLTGTPTGGNLTHLWTLYRVLDTGNIFGRNPYSWLNFYFRHANNSPFSPMILRKDRKELLQERMYMNCIRFTKEEVLPELPKKLYTEIPIQFDREGQKLYDEVRQAILDDIRYQNKPINLVITNILTELMKLQQITSGFLINSDKEIIELKYKPKLDTLIEQVETILDNDEAVVIWCRFHHSMNMISRVLKEKGVNHLTLSGKDSATEKEKKMKHYQESKDTNVMIGQISSGGVGIELFKIDSKSKYQHGIFFENIWGFDDRKQAEDRMHRLGQNSTCNYVDIVVEKTIDERIIQSNKSKQSIAESIASFGLTGFLA